MGLARLIVGSDGDQDDESRVMSIRGTMGYIDPDELATGELSTASDTYAFGLILLQMLTGITAVKQVWHCNCALCSCSIQHTQTVMCVVMLRYNPTVPVPLN